MTRTRDPIDWKRALRLFDRGWTHGEIAAKFGYSYGTVHSKLRELGARRTLQRERVASRHGIKLYHLWHFLKGRCDDPSHRDYADYGGRGVRFARAWHDFDTFYDWAVGSGYREGFHLARANRLRDFTPANCHWVSSSALRAGRPGHARVLIEAFGKRKSRADWARDRRCRVSRESLGERLAAGWPSEEAISSPPGSKPSRRVRSVAPPARRGSPPRIDWPRAVALYQKEELSENELARRFGATRQGIIKGLKRHGVRLRQRPKPTYDRERGRLYDTWLSLHSRCEKPDDPMYRFHGARGIRVARAWREFAPFEAWARKSGAKRGLWLVRTDRRKGYSPQNCEWTLPAEAVRRQGPRAKPHPTRLLSAFGETKGITAWEGDPRCPVRAATIGKRLAQGWTTQAAIAHPPMTRSCSDTRFTILHAFGVEKSKTEWLRDRRCGGVGLYGLNRRLKQGWTEEDAIATRPWCQPRSRGARTAG